MRELYLANTILQRAQSEKINITPMKLQKLIYIIYKEYLQRIGDVLFEKQFEVWKYGPVLSSVYDEFKKYKSEPIEDFYRENDGKVFSYELNKTDPLTAIFEMVWETYKHQSPWILSMLTHKEDTAWDRANKRCDSFLSVEDIREEESYDKYVR